VRFSSLGCLTEMGPTHQSLPPFNLHTNPLRPIPSLSAHPTTSFPLPAGGPCRAPSSPPPRRWLAGEPCSDGCMGASRRWISPPQHSLPTGGVPASSLPPWRWLAGEPCSDRRMCVSRRWISPSQRSLPVGDVPASTRAWVELPCLLGNQGRGGGSSCTAASLRQGYRWSRPLPSSPLSSGFELRAVASSSSE
jgi:hypothetical protein